MQQSGPPRPMTVYVTYDPAGVALTLMVCHPLLRGLKPYHAQILLYHGQLLARGRDEYVERDPWGKVGSRAVWVDGITHGGLEHIENDYTVNAERHCVGPRAVSIENMIAGARK